MKILKIKEVKGNKPLLFKVKLFKSKKFTKLIDNYYKIKTLLEHLETKRQILRAQIIASMESNEINSFDAGKYIVELHTMEMTRLDTEEMRKSLPPEQLKMFEFSIKTKALKILPKNEEEAVKDVIKEYPKIFKNA